MKGHIATELIGKPLLKALTNKPSIVLVRKPEFMELRPHIEIPLFQLLRHEELSSMASPWVEESTEEDMTRPTIGGYVPLIRKNHRNYPQDIQAWKELLTETEKGYDLLDPFERIGKALAIIHQQEARKPGG